MTRRYLRIKGGGRIDVNAAQRWGSPRHNAVLYLTTGGGWVLHTDDADPEWIEREEAVRTLLNWGHDFPIGCPTGGRMGRPPRTDNPTVANVVLPGVVYRALLVEATRLQTTRSNVVTTALRKHLGLKEGK